MVISYGIVMEEEIKIIKRYHCSESFNALLFIGDMAAKTTIQKSQKSSSYTTVLVGLATSELLPIFFLRCRWRHFLDIRLILKTRLFDVWKVALRYLWH
jgi:hypothetical protein